jgi:serine/threonine protein phosphatase PrpC
MRSSSQTATDVGRQRSNNEDSHIALDDVGLYAVADGVGGGAAGEVASRIFVEAVQASARSFAELVKSAAGDPDAHRDQFLTFLAEVFQQASQAIYFESQHDPKCRGMATTGVLVGIVDGWAAVGHAGDSRAYLLRNNAARQLTTDHTVAQELLDAGTLAPEDVPTFPYRGVLSRSVGSLPHCRPDTLWLDVQPGDRIVLCSDGLAQYFDLTGIARVCRGPVRDAITAANAAGGVDNVTAVFIDVIGRATTALSISTDVRMRLLADLYLFRELSQSELLKAMKVVREQVCVPGAALVREGDPADRLYAIVDGQLAVTKGGVTLAELKAGDHFGEVAFLDARPRSANVIARTHSTVLSVQRDEFLALCAEEPAIATKLLRSMVRSLSDRLRNTSEDFVTRR